MADWVTAPQVVIVNGRLLCIPPSLPPSPVVGPWERGFDAWLEMLLSSWPRGIGNIWKTVVFVGRYGAQPIDSVSRWPISQVLRVARHLQDYLEEENRKSSEPRSMRGGQGP